MPLVNVPGKGTVRFPDEMSVDEMDQSIREKWPDLIPKTAQPEPPARKFVFDPEADYPAPDTQTLKEFFLAHPNIPKPDTSKAPPGTFNPIEKAVTGLTRSAVNVFEANLTPLNAGLALAGSVPVIGKPLAVAAGTGLGAHTAIVGSMEFYNAVQRGDVQGAAEAAGNVIFGTGLVGLGVREAVKAQTKAPVVETKIAPITTEVAKEIVGEKPATPPPIPEPTPASPTLAPLTEAAAKEVYHGTSGELTGNPDLAKAGQTSGIQNEPVFWVTSDAASAKGFAEMTVMDRGGTAAVHKFAMDAKNPLTIEVGVKDIAGDFNKIKSDAITKAKEQGNDAVIFKTPSTVADEIAILDPDILKRTEPKGEIVEGPGAATAGFGTKSELEQLTDVVRGMEKSSIPLKDQFKASLDASMKGAKDLGEAAVAQAKGAYAYLKNKLVGPPGFTEWKRGVNKWNSEDQFSGRAAYFFAKETAKTIPQRDRQDAIGAWVDAGGDMAELRAGEATVSAIQGVDPKYKKAYADAQNLTPEELHLARNVQNYFEAKLQDAIDNGMLEAGLENYIHRIYPKENQARNNAAAMINAGVLHPNPSLIRKRLFKFDYEAIAAGKSPIQSFSARILAYDQSFNRALSARSFIKWLQKVHKEEDGMPSVDTAGGSREMVDPATGAREGVMITPHSNNAITKDGRPYIQYDHPALRNWKWVSKDADGNPILMKGDVLVHPDRVKKLDALLGKSWWRKNAVPSTVLKVSSTVKQTLLDLSVFHPVQIKAHSLEHRVGKLVDIDPMDATQRALIEHSLTIFDHRGHQMFSEGLAGGSLTKNVPIAGPWLHNFHDLVFKEWIPKVKMTMALDALRRNQKRYAGKLSEDDILYLTAKESNAAFGFQNYRDMGMHPSYQDALQATLLAPDFLISRAQFVGQAGTKYGKEQLEALALGAMVLYTTARIGNQMASGEWRWDKPFEVVVGGRSFSIRSVQEDLFNAIKDTRKFVYGRINPITTKPLAEAVTGRDYAGRTRTPLEQLGDLAKTPIPIAFRTEEQKKLWESMLAATGVVVKRASASQEIFKKAQKWKEDQGITEPGEFIYDPEKDPYRKLKIALSIGDEDDAKKALKDLKEDPATAKKVVAHMVSFYHRPFSGGLAREAKFKASLSTDDKKLYEDAKKEKSESLALFRKINN